VHKKLSIGEKIEETRLQRFSFHVLTPFFFFPTFHRIAMQNTKQKIESWAPSKKEINLNNRKRLCWPGQVLPPQDPPSFNLSLSVSLSVKRQRWKMRVNFFLFTRKDPPQTEKHLHWQVLNYGGCTLRQMGVTKIVGSIYRLSWQILKQSECKQKCKM